MRLGRACKFCLSRFSAFIKKKNLDTRTLYYSKTFKRYFVTVGSFCYGYGEIGAVEIRSHRLQKNLMSGMGQKEGTKSSC